MRLLRWLFVALFVLTLGLGIAVRLWGVANTDITSTRGSPLEDDAYYYFTLGRNIADGSGPRVDSLDLTTGFQPLWGLLVVIPYLILPQSAAIAGVQIMGVLISVVTFFVIYFFARQVTDSSVAGLIVAGLSFLAPLTNWEAINGMETPLVTLALVLILWCFYNAYQQKGSGWLIGFGLACGFAYLARPETAFLSAFAFLLLLILTPAKTRVRTFVTVAVLGAIPVLPWLIFTFTLDKSPVSESGQAMRTLAYYWRIDSVDTTAERISYIGQLLPMYWIDFQALDFPLSLLTFGRAHIRQLLWLVFVGICAVSVIRRSKMWQLILVFTLSVIAVFLAYATIVPAYWYFSRYIQPWAEVATVLFMTWALAYLIPICRRITSRRLILGLAGACVVYGILMFSNSEFLLYYQFAGAIVNPPRPGRLDSLYLASEWFNQNVPPTVPVGTFQTGLVSYYTHGTLLNLDGVVNQDASQALADQQMWEYICSEKIAYIADWPDILDGLLNPSVPADRLTDGSFKEVVWLKSGFSGEHPALIYKVNLDHCTSP